MNSSRNFMAFFTLITKKIGLYAGITKENIGYGKLSQDVRYKKLVESIQEKSDSNKEKMLHKYGKYYSGGSSEVEKY